MIKFQAGPFAVQLISYFEDRRLKTFRQLEIDQVNLIYSPFLYKYNIARNQERQDASLTNRDITLAFP